MFGRKKEALNTSTEGPVNVNYTVQTQQSATAGAGSSARTALALSKPAMMGVGLLGLGTLAVGLFSAFRVPGLNEQIEDLEAEVDRLEVQVKVLSFQNDRFEELNKELNSSLNDLEDLNEDLNATATKLDEEVQGLNETVNNLTEVVDDLEAEEQRLEESNNLLNETRYNLTVEIQELRELNKSWTETNEKLEENNEKLQDEVDDLEQTNEDLKNATAELAIEVIRLNLTNQALDSYINDLETIQAFMISENDTALDTLDAVVAELEDAIVQTRAKAFLSLAGYYDDLLGWDCLDDDIFWDKPWYNTPQGRSQSIVDQEDLGAYTDLIALIDWRMLRPMCLDEGNFQRFLTYESFPDMSHGEAILNITYDQVVEYSGRYGRDAIQFYGLTNVCQGLCNITEEQWEEASFDCTLLPYHYEWDDPR